MKKKKAWIWSLGIVALVGIFAAVYFGFIADGSSEEIGEVEEMPVMVQQAAERELGESILVTGEVVPEDEQKVYLDPENGEVFEYLVEENQQVKEGDVLFTYDVSKIDAEFGKAVRERDLVQKRLNIEQAEITEFGKRLTEMAAKVKKNEEFTEQDVTALSKEKVEFEMQHEGTKSEAASAQEAINELAAMKEGMSVVSKINGVVVKVNKNVEKSETGTSEPVIHIISSEPFNVIGTMSEFDAVKILPGQEVIIRPKVYKDREWKGLVESVSQFPEGESAGDDYGGGGNVTMYPFKVGITDETSELRQGFHVSLEVNLSGAEKKLSVPHMALMMDEEGVEYVYVLDSGLLQKRPIMAGDMNDEFLEITEGVAAGELVVIMPDEMMYDGMEVASFDEIE